jgi:hypothetical protein
MSAFGGKADIRQVGPDPFSPLDTGVAACLRQSRLKMDRQWEVLARALLISDRW